MNIKLPKEAEDLDVLATLFSPAQKHIGILIVGEDYLKEASNQSNHPCLFNEIRVRRVVYPGRIAGIRFL